MPDISVWVLMFGAIARITRWFNDDLNAGFIRSWFIRRFGPESIWASYPSCHWCVSIPVAAATVPLGLFYGHTLWFIGIAGALGLSWAYSLIAQNLDK